MFGIRLSVPHLTKVNMGGTTIFKSVNGFNPENDGIFASRCVLVLTAVNVS